MPGARIAYEAAPLNVHRRHAESVTHALKADLHVAEIARCHEVAAAMLPDAAGRLAAVQAAYLRQVAAQLGTTLPEPAPPKQRAARRTTRQAQPAARKAVAPKRPARR